MGWVAPQYGYWGDGANWDTGMLPSLGDDAVLGHGSLYSVFVAGAHEAGSLSITNPEARLEILEGGSLDLYGDLMTDGLVVVNPKGLDGASTLRFMTDAMLGGGGAVRLMHSDDPGGLIEVAKGSTLTVEEGFVVSGSGRVSGDLDLYGAAIGDDPFGDLVLGGGAINLYGSYVAGFGGSISIEDAEFRMHEGAVLRLLGPGSRLNLNNSDVYNLALTMGEGAVLHLPDSGLSGTEDDVWIRDSVIEGELEIVNGEDLMIVDSQIVDAQILMRVPAGSGGELSFGSSSEFLGEGLIRIESDDHHRTTLWGGTNNKYNAYEIEGFGRFSIPGTNVSEIRNLDPGKILTIWASDTSTSGFTNLGVVRAGQGSVIRLDGGLTQSDTGEIISDGEGSVVEIYHTIDGGILRGVDGGMFRYREDCELIDIENHAVIQGLEASRIHVEGEIENFGSISADLISTWDIVFSGDGELVLVGGESRIGGVGTPAKTFTNSAGHTVSGYGEFRSELINAGLISADVYEQTLILSENAGFTDFFLNSGILQAVGGGGLQIEYPVLQEVDGVLRAAGPGSQVILDDPRLFSSGPLISGGRITTSTGGIIRVADDVSLHEISVQGDIVIESGVTLEFQDLELFEGTIELVPGTTTALTTLTGNVQSYLEWSGTIRLGAPWERVALGAQFGGGNHFGPDMRIEGYGHDGTSVVLEGTLAPGFGIGDFEVRSWLTLSGSNSVLEVDVGPDAHDRVISTSTHREVSLHGKLRVSFVDGFQPVGYWAREIVLAPSLSVDLRGLEIGDPPEGLVSRTFVEQGSVWVGQTCLADINLDGQVDFFDTSEFLKWFQRGRYEADLNGDGELDFFDVTAFIVGYQQGCP